jgi:gliding motility-associated-like protein
MKILKTILFFLFFFKINAQTTFQKAFGTNQNEIARWVEISNDGQSFVVCGENSSDGTGIILKISNDGLLIWEKKLAENGTIRCKSVIRSATGNGYLCCGNNNAKGIFILKLDENGQILWQKHFSNADLAQRITKITGGYAICGVLQNSATFMILKINESGNMIWSNLQSGTDSEAGFSVIEQNNGDLLCFGTADYDGGIFKYNKNGNFLSCKTVGGSGTEGLYYADQFANGDFICGDHSWSWASGAFNYDTWIAKFDKNSNLLWSKTYPSETSVLRGMVKICSDDGLILVPTDYTTFENDGHLIRTDAQGEVVWAKSYGGSGNDRLFCAIQHPDGGFLAVGSTESFGSGGEDFFILKTNAEGLVDSCCIKSFPITSKSVSPNIGSFSPSSAGNMSNESSGFTVNSPDFTEKTACTPAPNPNFTINDTLICVGDCIQVVNIDPVLTYQYEWTFDGGTPESSSFFQPGQVCYPNSGSFEIKLVVTSGECVAELTKTVFVSDAGETEIDTVFVCPTDSIFLNGAWHLPPSVVLDTGATSFGCLAFLTTYVLPSTTLFTSETIEICSFDSIYLKNEWFFAPTTISDTSYSTSGCTTFSSIFLKNKPNLVKIDSIEICPNDSIFLKNNWFSPPAVVRDTVVLGGNQCLEYRTTFLFSKADSMAIDSFGFCEEDSIFIDGRWFFTPAEFDRTETTHDGCFLRRTYVIYQKPTGCPVICRLYFPNIFSPNDDGTNDYWWFFRKCPISNFNLKIFDRWGELLLETDNPDFIGWDGTFRGKKMMNGVYVYLAEFDLPDENGVLQRQLKKGDVTLVK